MVDQAEQIQQRFFRRLHLQIKAQRLSHTDSINLNVCCAIFSPSNSCGSKIWLNSKDTRFANPSWSYSPFNPTRSGGMALNNREVG
jgi:hypothetical protein